MTEVAELTQTCEVQVLTYCVDQILNGLFILSISFILCTSSKKERYLYILYSVSHRNLQVCLQGLHKVWLILLVWLCTLWASNTISSLALKSDVSEVQ